MFLHIYCPGSVSRFVSLHTDPDATLIIQIRIRIRITAWKMFVWLLPPVRPRGGDFLYSDLELKLMEMDIVALTGWAPPPPPLHGTFFRNWKVISWLQPAATVGKWWIVILVSWLMFEELFVATFANLLVLSVDRRRGGPRRARWRVLLCSCQWSLDQAGVTVPTR